MNDWKKNDWKKGVREGNMVSPALNVQRIVAGERVGTIISTPKQEESDG